LVDSKEGEEDSDTFEEPMQMASTRLINNSQINSKDGSTSKLPSLKNARLLDNKYRYIKDKVGRPIPEKQMSGIYKASVDGNKSFVLMESMGKFTSSKDASRLVNNIRGFVYDESIDPTKKDGWQINMKRNINESFQYGGSCNFNL